MTIFSKRFRTVLMGFCCFAFSMTIWAGSVPLDKVVAIVNNGVLTQSQLNETIETLKQTLQATNQPVPAPAVLRQKALDKAINDLLQLQVATRANITVSDADLTNAIGRVAAQNHLSVEQLKEAIQNEGINFSSYRAQLRKQMLIQQVQQQALGNKVHISEADVKAYMKKGMPNSNAQYRLDDLLIPLSETATSDEVAVATQQAKALLTQARAGTTFQALAKSPIQYTDLQWRTAQDLPSLFVKAVNPLKIGDITDPIRAPNGLHLLRLVDIRGRTATLTEAQAKQLVWQQKIQEQAEKWSQELRKSAYIKIM